MLLYTIKAIQALLTLIYVAAYIKGSQFIKSCYTFSITLVGEG